MNVNVVKIYNRKRQPEITSNFCVTLLRRILTDLDLDIVRVLEEVVSESVRTPTTAATSTG